MTTTTKIDELNTKIVSDIFQAVNYSGNSERLGKAFVEHIETEHRTLIQSFFRMIADVIDEYGNHKQSDERNKGSLEWAKKVSEIDYYMPLI